MHKLYEMDATQFIQRLILPGENCQNSLAWIALTSKMNKKKPTNICSHIWAYTRLLKIVRINVFFSNARQSSGTILIFHSNVWILFAHLLIGIWSFFYHLLKILSELMKCLIFSQNSATLTWTNPATLHLKNFNPFL